MARILFTLTLSLLAFAMWAQSPFQNISFESAIKKAAKENKLVLLQYEFADCDACSVAERKAFFQKKIAEKIKRNFIPVTISSADKDRLMVQELFGIKENSGMYFIDKHKNLIYASSEADPFKRYDYSFLIKQALERKKDIDTLVQKEKKYFAQSNKNIKELEQLIQAKTNLKQKTGLLLIEYLNLVPKDSVNTMHTLQFLARQSPVFQSKPDVALRSSPLFNQAWYDMPVQERISINNRTFKKSTQIAAANKDERLLSNIITFAKATYDTEEGKMYVEDIIKMDYYRFTENKADYMATAVGFYNRYADAIPVENPADKTYDKELPAAVMNARTPTVASSTPAAGYAYFLYSISNYFYYYDTENKYLQHTLAWAQKAAALAPNYNTQSLYALLLYKAGKHGEAVNYALKAIQKSKQSGHHKKEWEAKLEKMKKGESLK